MQTDDTGGGENQALREGASHRCPWALGPSVSGSPSLSASRLHRRETGCWPACDPLSCP